MAAQTRTRTTLLIGLLTSSLLFGVACADDPEQTDDRRSEPNGATGDDDEQGSDEDDGDKPAADAGRKLDGGAKPALDAGQTPPSRDGQVELPTADADAGTQPSSDAAADAASTADAAPPARTDLGKGDGKDVIAIGDSWMNLSGGSGIQQSLLKASGQKYRVYGKPGVLLLGNNLFGAAIPSQYEAAKREGADIKTVVMTGGGNDILMGIGGPKPTIDKVAVRLDELWAQMHEEGVQDVVYIQYSRGGTNAENVTYGASKVEPLCAASKVRCHYIDSDDIIMMQLRDGIHPTDAGYTALGKAVFALMEQEGIRR